MCALLLSTSLKSKLDNVQNTVAVVVGPPAMMRFSVQGLLDIGLPEENVWISQERKMCCGLGKCGHCKIGDTPMFAWTVQYLTIPKGNF